MCLKWGQPPLKGPSLPSPPSSTPPPPASSLPPSPSFPTGSLGDCGDTGRVVFLSRRTEVFKRGTRGRKGSPCRGHTNSSPSWSQRGRLQTGNHKSPQPGPAARPGSRNAVVCGGRAETGSLVFVNKNGERQGRGESWAAEASSCPPCSPHFSLSGELGARRWGSAVRCLLMCLAFLIFGTTGLGEE